MLSLAQSYWQKIQLNYADFVIIGGGIVGVNTAIALKVKHVDAKVVLIDKTWQGGGASIKNAGFVCFGSATELLDDLAHFGEQFAIDVFRQRWEGAALLRKTVGDTALDFKACGGVEYFEKSDPMNYNVEYLNSLVAAAVGEKDYFKLRNQFTFSSLNKSIITMPNEGSINPSFMMASLYQKAIGLGVLFLQDEVISVDHQTSQIETQNHGLIPYTSCGIATNGYSSRLIERTTVKPARNLVLVTSQLPKQLIDHVAHYDRGYIYFRPAYDNRLLVGGGRNVGGDAEYSDELIVNQLVKNYLLKFITDNLLPHTEFTIDYEWIGILGFGSDKLPKVQQLGDSTYLLAGLGGMGVAIGSRLGRVLAEQMEPK